MNFSDRGHGVKGEGGGGRGEKGVRSRRIFFGPLFLGFPDSPLGHN